MVFVSHAWLISLSIMLSSSIHAVHMIGDHISEELCFLTKITLIFSLPYLTIEMDLNYKF